MQKGAIESSIYFGLNDLGLIEIRQPVAQLNQDYCCAPTNASHKLSRIEIKCK
jgi:hypothetical protein